jgi:hypothetical protein
LKAPSVAFFFVQNFCQANCSAHRLVNKKPLKHSFQGLF